MKLWTAQTISVFGSGFTGLALPLLAMNALQATPVQMGLLRAAGMAPFLVLGLFVGVWVDRSRRRPILIAGDLGRALLLATIPIAASAEVLGMPQLYVVGLLVGVCTVFFDVAYQSYLPSLVDRDQLVEGNSKLEASRSIAGVASPGVAGVIIQVLSASMAILFDAVSFLASALLITRIRRNEASLADRRPMLAEVREGLSIVFSHPTLRTIAGMTGSWNFFSNAIVALYILYVSRTLGLAPTGIGVIFAAGNVAGVAGALLAAPLARRLGVGPVILASATVAGIGYAPVPLATPSSAILMLVASQALVSLALPIYNINQLSLRQATTPTRLQGRVNATMRFLVWGTIPLGSLFGGFLGEAIGLRPAIALSAAGAALAVAWILFSSVPSLKEIPRSQAV